MGAPFAPLEPVLSESRFSGRLGPGTVVANGPGEWLGAYHFMLGLMVMGRYQIWFSHWKYTFNWMGWHLFGSMLEGGLWFLREVI